MDIDPVPAYIVAVPPDRTIHLPADVPVGASVAVVLLSPAATNAGQIDEEDEEERRRRFERTLAAVRAAEKRVAGGPGIDEATLNALIDRARRT